MSETAVVGTKEQIAQLQTRESALRKEAQALYKERKAIMRPSTPQEIAEFCDAWAKRGNAKKLVVDEKTGEVTEEKVELNFERLTKEQQAQIDATKKARAKVVKDEQQKIVAKANEHLLIAAKETLTRTELRFNTTKKAVPVEA